MLSAAAIACFCAAVYRSQQYGALSGSTVLRYEEPSLTIEAVKDALDTARAHEGKVQEAALWSEYENQAVSNEWGRDARLRVIHIYGDGEQAYPMHFMAGAYPVGEDAAGCAVDQKAADALFGSQNVLGNTLTWQGMPYIVRGVLTGMEGVVVIQADEADANKFDTLALITPPGSNGREAVDSFVSSGGIVMPDAILDVPFWTQFVRALAVLPAWIIAITLIVKMAAHTIRLRAAPILCLCATVVTIAVAAVMLYAAKFSPPVPDRFIPTRWSDFSFWKDLAAQLRTHARQARSVDALISDYMRIQAVIGCGIFSVCSTVCFAGAMVLRPSFSLRKCLFVEFFIVGLTFLFLLLFAITGKPINAPRALWLTWALYIVLASVFQGDFRQLGTDNIYDNRLENKFIEKY